MININKKKRKKYKTITISIEILILIISIISTMVSILKNNYKSCQTSKNLKSQDKIYKNNKSENSNHNNSINDNVIEYNYSENTYDLNNKDVEEYRNSTIYDKNDKLKLISTCTTKLSTEREKEKKRMHNIKKAAEYINNITINPKAKFSFHKSVWAQNKYKVYKYADTLTQNGMDKGLGGGICQVSSTLFVAALKANMQIVERSPHSKRVTYLPIGLDASYETNLKDFSFINPFSYPIKIKTYFNNDSLTIDILSEHDENKNNSIFIKPAQILKNTKKYITVNVDVEIKNKNNKIIRVKHIKSCYKKD